jgi:hypothetical protein
VDWKWSSAFLDLSTIALDVVAADHTAGQSKFIDQFPTGATVIDKV